ncbi:MAG: thermonuclease family protein, partial [Spirochaetales bacterium]|nr:thermonuclease family protein [Spirochaetales bacterium]
IENMSNSILYLDLGFRIYLDKLEKGNKNYKDGSIVQVKENKNDYSFNSINEDHNSKLYTYKGFIKEIVDGDTLWVILELGFNTWTTKKVRLRGINAMPVETPPGKKVKKFICDQLNPCSFVIVKTYWRDKYNRYLADIFYNKNEPDANVVAERGTFLNQLLLDKGLVRKYGL